MFDQFGEMDSAAELNELAENLFNEGDIESLKKLAKENGVEEEIVDLYTSGELPELFDVESAAMGKLDVEAAELKPKEIMEDWTEYLRGQILENTEIAVAVRKKGKNLKGCIAALLKWSFKNQQEIDKEIKNAAGVNANRITLGIPGMAQAKKLIREYYLGGAGK